MKRFICLLLAIVCVLGLASCGGSELADFNELVKGSAPTTIKTITTVVGEEVLNGVYVTDIDGDDFDFTYSYERYATVDDNADSYIVTVDGVVYYKDGKFSEDGENWSASAPSVDMQKIDLLIDEKNFTEYTLSADGKTLVATFSADASEAVLGRKISATGDITMTVKTNGIYLTFIYISYESEVGLVTVDTSYTYAPVKEEAPQE